MVLLSVYTYVDILDFVLCIQIGWYGYIHAGILFQITVQKTDNEG